MSCGYKMCDELGLVLLGRYEREVEGFNSYFIDIGVYGDWEIDFKVDKRTRFSDVLESKVGYYDSNLERVKVPKENIFAHWSEFVSCEDFDSSTKNNTYDNISKDREYQIFKKQNEIKSTEHLERERKNNWQKNAKPYAWLVTNMMLNGNTQFYVYEDKILFECLEYINTMISRIETGKTVILCWVQGIPAGPSHLITLKRFQNALIKYLDKVEDDSLHD